MKLPIRILTVLLCAAIILFMPFALSSPQILDNEKARLMQDDAEEDGMEDEDSEEIDFGRLLFPSAYAEGGNSQETDEDVIVETFVEGELHINPEWKLPLDFSVPPLPNPDKYTENGYEDQSIRVAMETRDINGITVHIAFVRIADASQLRTAVAR